ncbi:MAG: hypothetical protein FWG81_01175 [Betaproteobacteria bacterium]|nr:hypothetical protein [Betaproteobacteria bacterium]
MDAPLSNREAARLNISGFVGLDRAALASTLAAHGLDYGKLLQTHPHLFADAPVFLGAESQARIARLITAIESVISLPAYQCAALTDAPEAARYDPGYPAVFMGYDFHLDADGCPWLIEINTNAGGAFLNTCLVEAESPKAGQALWEEWLAMFRAVWRSSRGERTLRRVALVDEQPVMQYLAPEFELFRRLFVNTGVEVLIADPAELVWNGQTLCSTGQPIDLVYNRLTDFTLAAPANLALKEAWPADGVVLTPHPYAYALYADKRNLVHLSDPAWLCAANVPEETQQILGSGIPKAIAISADMPQEAQGKLWDERKNLFFKPVSGFGSRAVYRGDKLTRKVFAEILKGNYIAQRFIPPSIRHLPDRALKVDIRCYVFRGRLQLYAARLYQGQATNFRTPGGGSALVDIGLPPISPAVT